MAVSAKKTATATDLTTTAARKTAASPRSSAASRAAQSAATVPPGQRLLHWATACGLLADQELPKDGLEHARLLELLGRELSLEQLGGLLLARSAELLLEAKTGAELAALIRALEKLPWWASEDPGPDANDSRPFDPAAGLPELDFDSAVEETRRLLAAIDAERAAEK